MPLAPCKRQPSANGVQARRAKALYANPTKQVLRYGGNSVELENQKGKCLKKLVTIIVLFVVQNCEIRCARCARCAGSDEERP